MNKQNADAIKPVFDNDTAIVFCCDNIYAPYLFVCLESLKANSNNDNKYDIIIFYSDLSEDIKNDLVKYYKTENISLRFCDLTMEVDNIGKELFFTCAYLTISMYYRFFIPKILKHYKRAVYCDSDILLLSDINDLCNINLKNKILGVTYDTEAIRQHYLKTDFVDYCQNTLKMHDSTNYFQSGILVFDIDKCLKFNLLNKCLAMLEHNIEFMYPDQDILNVVMENNVCYINKEWNVENHILSFKRNSLNDFSFDQYSIYNKALNNVKILHFSGSIKPWKVLWSPNSDIWWKYAKNTPVYEKLLYTIVETTCSAYTKQIKYGAINKIKNSLQYRIGLILTNCKNPLNIIILPIRIPLEFILYMLDIYIDKRISLLDSEHNIPLENYADYHESLKYKKHLAYRLGSAFLQNPLTFLFKVPSIYKTYKIDKKGR